MELPIPRLPRLVPCLFFHSHRILIPIMPLNTLRLNHQKSSHPNDRIVFIKPLERPPSDQSSYGIADTFLRAIAAQCLPLMKSHYLSVTTLEEHEPNPEFIGRNFNNGEIIQLVLTTKDGRWVPFNAVQMVMMHELAHNTHMNHGRDFWKTRNLYAEEMKALWAKNYTGEGFWGGGRTFNDMGSAIGNNTLRSGELETLPLCGGTFRSRNRKRRCRKGPADQPELTWKEKRDRRIEKKFGKNGVALGEDEDKRLTLEINRKGPIGGKPRVAQSARGRELRAAAALARFGTNKKEVEELDEHKEAKSESDDDYEDLDVGLEDARDVGGRKILDSHGHGMIRICGDDQDPDDSILQDELHDFNTLDRYFNPFQLGHEPPGILTDRAASAASSAPAPATPAGRTRRLESDTSKDNQSPRQDPSRGQPRAYVDDAESLLIEEFPRNVAADPASGFRQTRKAAFAYAPLATGGVDHTISSPASSKSPRPALNLPPAPQSLPSSTISCTICSLENPFLNATCMACSHVLDPRKDPCNWSCQSDSCRTHGSAYLNAGDVGCCGLCGARKP